MPPYRDPIIAFCWITFYVVWLIGALFTKRTAERVAWCLTIWPFFRTSFAQGARLEGGLEGERG
jgi:hypothetical protein